MSLEFLKQKYIGISKSEPVIKSVKKDIFKYPDKYRDQNLSDVINKKGKAEDYRISLFLERLSHLFDKSYYEL